MLLGKLGASLWANHLTSKRVMSAGQGTIRAGQVFNLSSSFNKFWNTKLLSKRT